MTSSKSVLMVWGGWEGHEPQACTELFADLLRRDGFKVIVSDSLDSYLNTANGLRAQPCRSCGSAAGEWGEYFTALWDIHAVTLMCQKPEKSCGAACIGRHANLRFEAS
jgi:hypothetical protein